MKRLLLGLWHYRYFVISSIKNEFKTRFIRSRLGSIWIVLHPLAQVLIYALVLSEVMRAKLPGVESQFAYPIYLLSGMAAWTLFSELMNRLMNVFIANANLMKKLAFPKLALPLIEIGSALLNFVLLLVAMFAVFIFLGHFPYAHILYLIPAIFTLLIFSVGFGLLLGILNVFIRDISQIFSIVLQFWFWLTPIVYAITIVPKKYHFLIYMNPMTSITEAFNKILLYDQPPQLLPLLYPLILGLLLLVSSMFLFLRAKEEITDVI